jgi:hypothetical protein
MQTITPGMMIGRDFLKSAIFYPGSPGLSGFTE